MLKKMGVQWVHWESSSVLMKIDLAPPPGHRSGGRRSRTALIWLLHLRVTAQEGRGQIDLAPPPHLRGSLLHGDWEVEQPCFLVGNNQLTSPTPYTPYYYRPELVMLVEYIQYCRHYHIVSCNIFMISVIASLALSQGLALNTFSIVSIITWHDQHHIHQNHIQNY